MIADFVTVKQLCLIVIVILTLLWIFVKYEAKNKFSDLYHSSVLAVMTHRKVLHIDICPLNIGLKFILFIQRIILTSKLPLHSPSVM